VSTFPLYNPENPNDLIAYAFEISGHGNADSSSVGDIIFVPGFSVSEIYTEQFVAGDIASYQHLLTQLKTDWFHVFENEYSFVSSHSNSYIDYLASVLGYRVWLIDFVDKRARIQRNSLAVQALLQDVVYRYTTGDTSNHIFGYSMGGLIARHALLKLQQKGTVPQLDTFVSLDAPHRGAFLPPAVEVVTRTIPRMADGGSVEFALTAIESGFRRFLQPFDSSAARQMLGIYIGSGVPDMGTDYFGVRHESADYEAFRKLFNAIESDQARAPDPAYYDLRQELTSLGGYPRATVNIGVSFGARDGQILRASASQSETPLAWNIRHGSFTLAGARYHSTDTRSLCRVETAGRQPRICPSLKFSGGHLEGVLVAPGSTTPIYGEIAQGIQGADQSLTTPLGLLGATRLSKSLPIDSSVSLDSSEASITLIPTVSAWDDNDWAYSYLNADGQDIDTVDTPFDVVLANSPGQSSDHTFINRDLSEQIFQAIATRLTLTGSSYFNARGGFDLVRYGRSTSSRGLPIHNRGPAYSRPSSRGQIASLVALF
nr:alpha/beta hydrolase [Gammaproteobacteria bacterium]